jgi:hypothetical protein
MTGRNRALNAARNGLPSTAPLQGGAGSGLRLSSRVASIREIRVQWERREEAHFNLEPAFELNREPREIRESKTKQQHALTANRFTRRVNTASCPACFPFAYFVYFAVSTAEFRFKTPTRFRLVMLIGPAMFAV